MHAVLQQVASTLHKGMLSTYCPQQVDAAGTPRDITGTAQETAATPGNTAPKNQHAQNPTYETYTLPRQPNHRITPPTRLIPDTTPDFNKLLERR
jgi:hypothetical protein